MPQSTPTTQNFPSSPEDCKKLIEPISAGPSTLSLAHFIEKQIRHLHQQPQPHILHGHTMYAAPPLPNPNLPVAAPASGARRGAGREPETLPMRRDSKVIRGQPAAVLGGDGCSREPGWDKCAAELVAVFCTLLLGIPHFSLPRYCSCFSRGWAD